jgi:hypothetical protein
MLFTKEGFCDCFCFFYRKHYFCWEKMQDMALFQRFIDLFRQEKGKSVTVVADCQPAGEAFHSCVLFHCRGFHLSPCSALS